ncbi:hypothetical protein NDU88_005433 [Pleurodeles waltl]|uniref:Uncharacterized protein n=1 Tax=Pleurodeles waltl TaxID=8319 RepID=A0AAV7QEQ3_PLEWA|nr:hypothetical protein NDU88_005433 [Pleurodeles waltl]
MWSAPASRTASVAQSHSTASPPVKHQKLASARRERGKTPGTQAAPRGPSGSVDSAVTPPKVGKGHKKPGKSGRSNTAEKTAIIPAAQEGPASPILAAQEATASPILAAQEATASPILAAQEGPPATAQLPRRPPPAPSSLPRSAPPATAQLPRRAPPATAQLPNEGPPAPAQLGNEGPPTQAPLNRAPPTQATLNRAPPTQAPLNRAPPTQAPLNRAPPTQAPLNRAPPTQAPLNRAPPTQALLAHERQGHRRNWDRDGVRDALWAPVPLQNQWRHASTTSVLHRMKHSGHQSPSRTSGDMHPLRLSFTG